jgi:hypothetical protein
MGKQPHLLKPSLAECRCHKNTAPSGREVRKNLRQLKLRSVCDKKQRKLNFFNAFIALTKFISGQVACRAELSSVAPAIPTAATAQ